MIKVYSGISTQLEISAHGGYQDILCANVSFDVYNTSYNLMEMHIISHTECSNAIKALGFDV